MLLILSLSFVAILGVLIIRDNVEAVVSKSAHGACSLISPLFFLVAFFHFLIVWRTLGIVYPVSAAILSAEKPFPCIDRTALRRVLA